MQNDQKSKRSERVETSDTDVKLQLGPKEETQSLEPGNPEVVETGHDTKTQNDTNEKLTSPLEDIEQIVETKQKATSPANADRELAVVSSEASEIPIADGTSPSKSEKDQLEFEQVGNEASLSETRIQGQERKDNIQSTAPESKPSQGEEKVPSYDPDGLTPEEDNPLVDLSTDQDMKTVPDEPTGHGCSSLSDERVLMTGQETKALNESYENSTRSANLLEDFEWVEERKQDEPSSVNVDPELAVQTSETPKIPISDEKSPSKSEKDQLEFEKVDNEASLSKAMIEAPEREDNIQTIATEPLSTQCEEENVSFNDSNNLTPKEDYPVPMDEDMRKIPYEPYEHSPGSAERYSQANYGSPHSSFPDERMPMGSNQNNSTVEIISLPDIDSQSTRGWRHGPGMGLALAGIFVVAVYAVYVLGYQQSSN